jgi:hypothetical protein
MTAREHYEALCRHGMAGAVDYMLVHAPESVLASDARTGLYDGMIGSPARSASSSYGFSDSGDTRVRPVGITRADIAAIEKRGTRVIARDLVDNTHPTWHDPAKLRRAFLEVLKLCRSPRM